MHVTFAHICLVWSGPVSLHTVVYVSVVFTSCPVCGVVWSSVTPHGVCM